MRRWEHRLTLVVGGPGLGKTTLLAQAVAENHLAPRGDDIWLGLGEQDSDATVLGRDLLTALGVAPIDVADAETVTAAVWSRAPTPVCLVLDDVQVVASDSSGLRLLAALLGALPSNGHLMLGSRTVPGLPYARLAAQGLYARILQDQLRFDDAELRAFAQTRGLEPDALESSGGWPAMAALHAATDVRLPADYVRQEVLEPLDPGRRRVISALIALGGGDGDVLAAALGERVDVAAAVDGIPLISVSEAAWYSPHPLWKTILASGEQNDDTDDMRRRAIRSLADQGRLEDAFDLIERSELWDQAPPLLREASLDLQRYPPAQHLRRWLQRCPPEIAASPGGRLATGVLATLDAPDDAAAPLLEAVKGLREDRDTDGELSAIAYLGRVAWWTNDMGILAQTGDRVRELQESHPMAAALAAVGRAVVADLAGDSRRVLEVLPTSTNGPLGTTIAWMRGCAYLTSGHVAEARQIAAELLEVAEPSFVPVVQSLYHGAGFLEGRISDYLDYAIDRVDRGELPTGTHNMTLAAADTATKLCCLGDVARGQAIVTSLAQADVGERPRPRVRMAQAAAALRLSLGDEAAATTALRDAIDDPGLDLGAVQLAWRECLALVYVLCEETRHYWDSVDLDGCWLHVRDLARTVAALRDGRGDSLARSIDVADLNTVRARLHHRLAAELAIGLHAVGRPEGSALLEALGGPGRRCVRDIASRGEARVAERALQLLAAAPAPPPVALTINVLGPIEVQHDGEIVEDSALRRDRVRALLALLVVRRSVPRSEVMAALWPDFDDRSAANNLRVNLSHLNRALEPWRADGEPAWTVRHQGTVLRLTMGQGVTVDVHEFESDLTAAWECERNGAPSTALDHLLSAVDYWRGEPFAGVPEADWLDLKQAELRSRFVRAAVRAGHLLVGRGEPDAATALAQRALAVDPWSEPAHAVLISAALFQRDRSGASAALARCMSMLDELGVEPSDTTRLLARRVRR